MRNFIAPLLFLKNVKKKELEAVHDGIVDKQIYVDSVRTLFNFGP